GRKAASWCLRSSQITQITGAPVADRNWICLTRRRFRPSARRAEPVRSVMLALGSRVELRKRCDLVICGESRRRSPGEHFSAGAGSHPARSVSDKCPDDEIGCIPTRGAKSANLKG